MSTVSAVLGKARLLDELHAALKSPEADGLEASYVGTRRQLLRFAGSRVVQPQDVVERTVQIRAVLGRRVGVAATSDTTAGGLGRVVASAIAAARVRPPQESFPGLPSPSASDDAGEMRGCAEATLSYSTQAQAHQLEVAFDRARLESAGKAHCAGLSHAMATELCVVSTAGTARYALTTSAMLKLIAQIGPDASGGQTPSGYACALARDVSSIDPAAVAQRAAEKAARGVAPIELQPGQYDVVLEPTAVSEILEWLGFTAFGARAVEDGTSFMAGRQGEQLVSPLVTILDEGRSMDPQALHLPFDAQGVPKERVVLVDNGVLGGPVHDTVSAARAGCSATGHAPPLGEEIFSGPLPGHLFMGAGEVDSVDGLCARMGRGLLVTRFHYVNGLLDTRRALMTGLTRDGLFLVENGRIKGPVRNLRFTQSMVDALARCEALTRSREAVPTWWSSLAANVVPAVLVRGFAFTGQVG